MVFFPLSWTVVHPIDEASPLWGVSEDQLLATDAENTRGADWEARLRNIVEQRLARGDGEIFKDINDSFERILIEAALKHTGGRKLDAAKKLGWGRNTLTRKLKDLGL